MSKRILIFTNSSNGLCSFRYELIKDFINKNNQVFCSMPFDGKHDMLENLGCHCIETEVPRRGLNPIEDLKLLFKYIRLIKKIKPDIVLCYTIKPNVYGGLACQLTRIPYICNITGLGTAIENGGLLQKIALLLYKIGLKKAKKVFFQNSQNQQFMLNNKVVTGNNQLLPGSGVNLDMHCYEEYPLERDVTIFLIIGRIMKEKGTDEILQAIDIIRKENKLVIFKFIGGYDGDYKEKIENAVAGGNVEYLGQQNDVHSFIKDCDAVLHASYHEGMSNVLLEAASCGRPVLATSVAGCRETYDDGVSGISFKVKDSNDIVRAINEFLNMPYSSRIEMGKAGRQKMESEFDRNIIIDIYTKTIAEILN